VQNNIKRNKDIKKLLRDHPDQHVSFWTVHDVNHDCSPLLSCFEVPLPSVARGFFKTLEMKGVMMKKQTIKYCRDARRASKNNIIPLNDNKTHAVRLYTLMLSSFAEFTRTVSSFGGFTRTVSPFGGGRGRILSILSLFLLLLSCTEDQDQLFPTSVPATFTASVVDDANTPETQTDAPETRAAGTTWTAGDNIGIHMTPDGSLGTAGFTRYLVEADQQTFSPEGTGLYYPADGSKVNFIAFYPYNSSTTISSNKVTYTLTAQSTQEAHEAVDFMYAKDDTKYFSASNPQANLTFKHKLSRVIVNITAASSVNISALTMAMYTMPTTVDCDLTTGTPTAGTTAGTTTPFKAQSSSTSVTYQAIVAPHAASDKFANRRFYFSYGGITYTYYVNNSNTYESGHTYTYNFTAYASGVTLTSMNSTHSSSSYPNTVWNADGTQYLGLSQSRISVPRAGVTDANFTLIKSSSSTATVSSSNINWLTVSLSESKISYTATAATIGTTREATITVTVDGLSATCTVKQAAYINTSGTIVESANCIVMTPGSTSLIPISFLNEVGNYPGVSAGRDAYTKPFPNENNVRFDAKVLWVDEPNFSSASLKGSSARSIINAIGEVYGSGLTDSYLYLQSGSYQGNAVVCITKPGTDEIIWSWHIWVTNEDLWTKRRGRTDYPEATANGYAFFPLNLGAFSAEGTTTSYTSAGWNGHPYVGLYYQWGRKDPMPNRAQPSWIGTGLASSGLPYISNVSALTTNTGTAYNGLNSIQYPYNFPFSDNTTTGWIGTIHYGYTTNKSWGYDCVSLEKKSPFDPCPAGWRVPPGYGGSPSIHAWTGASRSWAANYSLYGISMTNYGGHYVAGGYKSGTFKDNGYGYYSSASGYGAASAYGLAFASSGFDILYMQSRHYGYLVRCILE